LNEAGELTFVTHSLATYLGREPDQLVGTALTSLLPPNEVSSCEAVLREVQTAAGATRATVETEVQVNDGDVRPVQFEFSATTTERDEAAVAAVLHDISELAATRTDLEAERERFRELFENLPDPVVEVRFDTEDPIIEYSNPAFSDVFGYGKERARGANLNTLVVPDEHAPDAGILYQSTQTDEEVRVDVRRETADGRRDFLVRSIPFSLDGEQFAFAVYTDITEQKERERYLQVIQRVLRHNLRNDMNVVMGMATHLSDQIEDEDLSEYATTLHETAVDVTTLTEKANEIERILSRRQNETQPIDVVPRLQEAISEVQSDYPNAEIDLDTPEELWLNGGENVTRAFREVTENGIEHTDAEHPRVTISARKAPDSDERVEIRFTDNGPGIPDSEWNIVAGNEDISQLTHASGLGLWLTRWIVESYGGEMRREQTPTAGARVALRFPHETFSS
jgi:PAS domain S-box-containing protein